MSALYDIRQYIIWDLVSPTLAHCFNEACRYKTKYPIGKYCPVSMHNIIPAHRGLQVFWEKFREEHPGIPVTPEIFLDRIIAIEDIVKTYIFNINKKAEKWMGSALLHERYWSQHSEVYDIDEDRIKVRERCIEEINILNEPINKIILQNLLEYPGFIYVSYSDWLADVSKHVGIRAGHNIMNNFEKNLIQKQTT